MNESFEINEEFERLAALALPQLLAIDPEIFGQLVEYELEKFRNFSTVFHRIANKKRIMRNIVDEVHKPIKINAEANEWLGDMLGNISNLIGYLEEYPDRVELRKWNEVKK